MAMDNWTDDNWSEDEVECTATLNFTFRLGRRIISGCGTQIAGHKNVHRLHIPRGKIDIYARLFLRILPRAFQAWIKALWPEWFLPSTVILKRQKPGWRREFDAETRAYETLRAAQGDVIPVCYGVALCSRGDWGGGTKRRRTLVLSDVGGTALDSSDCPKLESDQLRKMLRDAYQAMAKFGVINDDHKMQNHHVVGDRIVVLDLELTDSPRSHHEMDKAVELAVDDIVYFWDRRQDGLAEERAMAIAPLP